jgi:hypothetical protein
MSGGIDVIVVDWDNLAESLRDTEDLYERLGAVEDSHNKTLRAPSPDTWNWPDLLDTPYDYVTLESASTPIEVKND